MRNDDPTKEPPALWVRSPRIRTLSTLQAEYILARNHTGHLAFIADGRPELLPLHYVYSDGEIFGRTSFGMKCLSWEEQPEVVFSVEESDGLFDWRSVHVRGRVRLLSHRGTTDQRSEYWSAVDIARTLVPGALTERDPTPERRVLFAVAGLEITGREASTRFLP